MGEPATVNATRMTGGVLPALGVAPLMGRVSPSRKTTSTAGGGAELLDLAEPLSRRREILGKKILLDRKPYVVIGVMPRNFEFPLVPGHLNRASCGFRSALPRRS